MNGSVDFVDVQTAVLSRMVASDRECRRKSFGLKTVLNRVTPISSVGVAFVPTFFGALGATGRVKQEDHLCSKRS
jgi:hypothetical protein